jgi:hypothetical protein
MESIQSMAMAINSGRNNILPTVPSLSASAGAVGAQILLRQEAVRLQDAALYYVTGDMTALTLAAATTPPVEAMTARRLPSECGLIVFAEPIGGYTEDIGATISAMPGGRPGTVAHITVPIVAASWSTWRPDSVQLDQGKVEWLWRRPGEQAQVIGPDFDGVWVTWYSAAGKYAALDPDAVLGIMPDGVEMTPRQISELTVPGGAAPLTWDNEIVMGEGAPFGPATADTTDQWMHALYTAWQMMGQRGKSQLTDAEELPRTRAGRKRDARDGITEAGTVRIVKVHTAHRPPPAAGEQDAAASSGRRAPQWSCRWPVRPHRRDHCMNPALHQAGDCHHEDRIIPAVVKGPADKPLRLRETVNLWDSQPS